jgi:hypothetical protein
MAPAVIVKGKYTNRTFVPEEPFPAEEGLAELVIHPNPVAPQTPEPGAEVYYIRGSKPSHEEFRRLLRELATGPRLPHLPPDFSREDIYDDHD